MKVLPNPPPLDSRTREFWDALAQNPLFHKILQHCESHRGEYSQDRPLSQYQHIQIERNGGIKAWNNLCNLLLNPPRPQKEEEIEYID